MPLSGAVPVRKKIGRLESADRCHPCNGHSRAQSLDCSLQSTPRIWRVLHLGVLRKPRARPVQPSHGHPHSSQSKTRRQSGIPATTQRLVHTLPFVEGLRRLCREQSSALPVIEFAPAGASPGVRRALEFFIESRRANTGSFWSSMLRSFSTCKWIAKKNAPS